MAGQVHQGVGVHQAADEVEAKHQGHWEVQQFVAGNYQAEHRLDYLTSD